MQAMRFRSLLFLAFGLLLGMTSPAFCDNLIQNADFKEGTQDWHGDAKAVFLKPDGTEGDETDPGVAPVLRLALAKGHPLSVYQVIHSKDAAGRLNLTVQVFASIDFKKSTHADDYALESDFTMPVVDFMVRFAPDWFEQDSALRPGEWVTVRQTLMGLTSVDERSIYFVVPPGDGFVYIKNPSLTP